MLDSYQTNSIPTSYQNYNSNTVSRNDYNPINYNNYNNYNDRYGNENYPIMDNPREEIESTSNYNNNSSINNNNNSNQLSKISKKPFLVKVIVDNVDKPNDISFLLDTFAIENHYQPNFETITERKKIIFIFDDEKIAFNFTKFLHSEKAKNENLNNINIHLNLVPTENYSSSKKTLPKKRGLSLDSIQRLFNGIGPKKEEKKGLKINPNLDLGVSSPFSYPYEKKRNKKNKKENLQTEEGVYKINKEELKDYMRTPIRVLDTHYQGLKDYEFRKDDKSKWVSPSNFKF